MINIEEQDGCIKIKGHAEYDDNGHDLVCAGVSTLAWTLVTMLKRCEALNYVEEESGDMTIYFENTKEAEPYLDYFRTGTETMSMRWPENVAVQGRKENP
jgi:uncharacterized protein YsxB (DUF464 family)